MKNLVLETLDEFATRRNNENINNYNDGYEQALVDILEMIEADASYDEMYETIGGYLIERNKENQGWKDNVIQKPQKEPPTNVKNPSYKKQPILDTEKVDRLRDQFRNAENRNAKKVGKYSLAGIKSNDFYQKNRQAGNIPNVPKFTKNNSARIFLKNELEDRKEKNKKGIFNFK